ncbi:TIGR02444 family protein [Bowmanella yangjiangensis]|uniref:TIGR02444 family protein n=1 Tax=Bowmanella yangjiangensis TaxID=2811230 RepID=A0ABS3CQ07_9ALTE|nr:TIGR02444 family protein [Bowmanella yangjiangensis]
MWQTEDFWQFSLAVYKEAEHLCLQLQNRYAMNVNLVLLCLFLQHRSFTLSDKNIRALVSTLADTESLLQSLRALRRQTKAFDLVAYQHLLSGELALEKRQQADLIACLNTQTLVQAEGDNLYLYALALNPAMPHQLKTILSKLQTETKFDQGQNDNKFQDLS